MVKTYRGLAKAQGYTLVIIARYDSGKFCIDCREGDYYKNLHYTREAEATRKILEEGTETEEYLKLYTRYFCVSAKDNVTAKRFCANVVIPKRSINLYVPCVFLSDRWYSIDGMTPENFIKLNNAVINRIKKLERLASTLQ